MNDSRLSDLLDGFKNSKFSINTNEIGSGGGIAAPWVSLTTYQYTGSQNKVYHTLYDFAPATNPPTIRYVPYLSWRFSASTVSGMRGQVTLRPPNSYNIALTDMEEFFPEDYDFHNSFERKFFLPPGWTLQFRMSTTCWSSAPNVFAHYLDFSPDDDLPFLT